MNISYNNKSILYLAWCILYEINKDLTPYAICFLVYVLWYTLCKIPIISECSSCMLSRFVLVYGWVFRTCLRSFRKMFILLGVAVGSKVEISLHYKLLLLYTSHEPIYKILVYRKDYWIANRRKLGLVGLILLRLILIGFGVFGRGLLDVLGLSSFVWYAFIFILYYSISINPLPRR